MATTETKTPGDTRRAVVAGLGNIMETETTTTETTTTESGFESYSRQAVESLLVTKTERVAELVAENDRLRFSQIEGGDHRLTDFWEKARRIAENAGFCTEYDKIAVALGGPARMLDWSGLVNVTVTMTVTVPVGGTATPEEVENHTMDYEADSWNVLDALKQAVNDASEYDLDYETDTYSLEVTDTEPAD
jgi:hypothetical protein